MNNVIRVIEIVMPIFVTIYLGAFARKSNKISEMQNSIIKGIAMMVESRDNSTGGHINRTSTYVQVFVNHLKNIEGLSWLDDKFADCLVKAAPMHDLGKIAVNDEILRKPGKFTPEEYEKMNREKENAPLLLPINWTMKNI